MLGGGGKPLEMNNKLGPYLQGKHGGLVRHVDVVPYTEAVFVLRHDDVALWYPLNVGAVGEEAGLSLGLNIVEV